jgi:hypothetical protein
MVSIQNQGGIMLFMDRGTHHQPCPRPQADVERWVRNEVEHDQCQFSRHITEDQQNACVSLAMTPKIVPLFAETIQWVLDNAQILRNRSHQLAAL